MKKVFWLLIIILLATSLSIGCQQPEDKNGEKPSEEKILTVMYPFGNDTLDPKIDYAQLMRSGIGEALTRIDKDLKVQMWLAESAVGNEDSSEWVITLKSGITFSNGKSCDAEAVRVWLQRMIEENNAMRSSLNIESMEADGLTLKIKTAAPNPILLNELSQPQAVIIDLEAGSFDTQPVTTGPYKVETFTPSVRINMVKNENYWNGDVPFDRVNWIINNDSSSRMMALEAGDADMIASPSFDAIDKLAAKEDISLAVANLGARANYISFNTSQKYTDNKYFRTAIDYLIDRESIVKYAYNNMAMEAIGAIPLGLATTPKYVDHSYNVEKALEYFEKAGLTVKDGKVTDNGQPITLRFGSFIAQPEYPTISQIVQSDLAKVGINAEIFMISIDVHAWLGDESNNESWDMCMNSSFAVPKGDPFNILNNAYYESSVWCYIGIGVSDSELNSLIDAIRGEGDIQKREELLKETALYAEDQAYIAFFANPKLVLAYNNKITGVVAYPNESYISTGAIAPVK